MASFSDVLSLLFVVVLSAPKVDDPVARCAAWGDTALLGDLEKYKSAQFHVKKGAHPCVVYHAAMAKLKQAEKTPSRYLLVAAAELFAKIDETANPVLFDWARVRRLELAARLKDPKLAPKDLPPGLPSPERRFLLDTELLALDSPAMALAAHATKPLTGRFRLQQIGDMMALLDKGAPQRKALEDELATDWPDSWLAPKQETMTEEQLLKRLAVWHGRHANNQVVATVRKALREDQISPEGRCVASFFLGAAERKLRHYALAERALSESMAICLPYADQPVPQNAKLTPIQVIASSSSAPPPPPAEAYKRAWFLLGQVQAISRSYEQSQETLTKFVERYKEDPLSDDALLQAAAAAKRSDSKDRARAFMERVVKEQQKGDMCAEAAFRLAWQTFRNDTPDAAVAAFAALPQNGCVMEEAQVARGHYWHARALAKANAAQADIDAALDRAFKAAPLHYYGMVARLRLKGTALPPLEEAPVAAPTEHGPPLAASGPTVNVLEARIAALASVGLYVEAQQELTNAKPGDAPTEELVSYARLQTLAHDYYRAHRPFRSQLKPVLGLIPSPKSRTAWESAFPRPFEAHFARTEREEKLPRDLLLSLVREESAFQLDAGSWANAYGFTQLLVETAERTAADIPGFSKTVSADLLRKEALVSLQLGAHLLGMLQKRYKTVPLMLAAYNAGEDAVDHWIKARGWLPMDEFIEEIPFDETRGYVKRILGTWQIYRALGEKDLPSIAFSRSQGPLKVAENP